jgi:hypothetical protein
LADSACRGISAIKGFQVRHEFALFRFTVAVCLTVPFLKRRLGCQGCWKLESDRLRGRTPQLAKPAPIRSVHLQQANRSSAYRSSSDNDDSVALKVLIPLVLARMKQPDECATSRVKPAQVGPLWALQW